ncbi:MAG: HAD family hydrolase [Actinomycetota bacterium]|nr:HAD family hydrolase [Actinomycetota bacterium]
MPLRAVLFDYGHTLVDFHRTEEALLEAYRHVRELVVAAVDEEAAGRVPDAGRLVRLVTTAVDGIVEASYAERRLEELDLLGVYEEVLGGLGLTLPPEVIHRVVTLDHLAFRSCIILPTETREVLGELRGRGLAIGFVSNAHFLPDLLREDLDLLGLAELIDAGAFSSELGTRKPDSRIFHHVLGELGVAAGDAVHIGDRVRDDIGGARSAGLAGGILTHQWRQEQPDGRELALIRRLGDLPAILDRLT